MSSINCVDSFSIDSGVVNYSLVDPDKYEYLNKCIKYKGFSASLNGFRNLLIFVYV